MDALGHYRGMLRIRRFEERLLALFRDGELRGTAHVCLGQEAVATGACAALEAGDFVTSNHRGHGHMLARGADLKRVMAELFGREAGYSQGRGGSQHIAALEVGFLGSNGITGGGLPVAAGAALSQKMRGSGGVCLAFFGDGATAQGTFHEAMNLAALWGLPLIFLCENNQYAMGTPVRETCPTPAVADRAAGYGMARCTVDGNEPLAVEAAVREARARASAGAPSLVECLTWRMTGHSRSDACDYRPPEEESLWRGRDPLPRLRASLVAAGREAEVAATEREVEAEIEEAVAFSRAAPPLPVSQVLAVYPEPRVVPIPPPAGAATECTVADAIHLALDRALADPSVLLLGEDVAAYRGAFRVTRDLWRTHGAERVRNTPISENTIVGAGVGLAMTGWRPIVEIMFMDFLLLALDQLANHAAKFHSIFGRQARVPLTVRTPAGGRRGYGATHSQCFESLLLPLPGLRVVCPATPQDAYDLLLQAVFGDAPTVVVEHKLLYGAKGPLTPGAPPPWEGPEGRVKARVVRAGSALTIVAFSHMVELALQAAALLAEDGIEAEVIDLRSLVPCDFASVAESACRTQRVLVAEEGVLRGGVGAEIAARLQEECFGSLDAPVLRVGAAACPVPAALHLERAVLPQVADLVAAARRLLGDGP